MDKIRIITVVIFATMSLGITAFFLDDYTKSTSKMPTVIQSTEFYLPTLVTQCDNPWDEYKSEWIKQYNYTALSYDESLVVDKKIIRNYFADNGINVSDLQYTKTETDQNCEGCSCHTGQILNLLIHQEDVGKIKKLGVKPLQPVE